jgi:hypothetical protein
MGLPPTKPDQLIVVVHGVGDPEPGDTLTLFARSIAPHDQPLSERSKTTWLSEKSSETDHVQTFPVHQRSLTLADKTTECCELFWGDLSRVRKGWLGVIDGLFQIIFGLRYVAYVAADQPGPAAYWLKRLGLLTSKILHGPVLAVTAYLALLMVTVCGTHAMWPASYESSVWTQVVLAGCAMVAILASTIGYRLTRSRVVERFLFWLNVTAMFVTGLMFLKSFYIDPYQSHLIHECPIHPGLLWYCRVLLVLLGLLWFIEIQVLIAMAVCWLVSLTHPRAYRPALHVAFLLPALAVGIWGQVLPMLWVSAKEGVSLLAKLPGFAQVFDDAIPFLGVQLMMAAVILVATAITLGRYYWWRKNASQETFQNGSRAPRLIVNEWLQIVLAACTMIGVLMVSTLCILKMLDVSYQEFWFGKMMVEANKYAIGVVVPIGSLMLLLLPRLRPGFDIALDVVNHFYFRPTNIQDALNDDDEFDIAETTFENGSMFFSRRDAIHVRLIGILAHYRDLYDHHPELVIVSHSQGTMAAIEVLNDEDLAWLNHSFRSVKLVTMGSPLNHLYQHYFGHCYPILESHYWSSLRRRIDQWTNIYRIDDFVGTNLEFPDQSTTDLSSGDSSMTQQTPSFAKPVVFENFPVGLRGHVSYWSDREVLDVLKEQLFETRGSTESKNRNAA